jgi:5-methylthioadenosine/S-adenosylhomocysteine deaminase
MSDRFFADYVLPMDDGFSIHAPGYVDVAEGRVVAVGDASGAPSQPAAREHHFEGVLMPGLVNGHAHSAMTVLRGAGEGLPLDRWLTEVIWPREARMRSGDAGVGMIVGAAEMLLGGVTTTNEMYFFPEAIAEGARSTGMRSVVNVAIIEAPGVERFGTPEEAMGTALALRDRYAADDLVEIGLGPHSAYTLSDAALRDIGELAAAEGLPLHIHLAETRTEGDAVTERTGKTVPRHLADLGVFAGRVSAAHCVWLDEADVLLLAEHSVGVAHCPGSNGKLASGVAPVAAMRRRGIAVGAATDGPASNNDLDLWEEARLALLYARLREDDAAVLGVEDALRMVTSEAAAALSRPDLGALAPGRWADMIRVSLDHVAYDPIHTPEDVVSDLVWAGSARDVADVWVGGVQVVADRAVLTVDVDEARHDLRAAALRIAG